MSTESRHDHNLSEVEHDPAIKLLFDGGLTAVSRKFLKSKQKGKCMRGMCVCGEALNMSHELKLAGLRILNTIEHDDKLYKIEIVFIDLAFVKHEVRTSKKDGCRFCSYTDEPKLQQINTSMTLTDMLIVNYVEECLHPNAEVCISHEILNSQKSSTPFRFQIPYPDEYAKDEKKEINQRNHNRPTKDSEISKQVDFLRPNLEDNEVRGVFAKVSRKEHGWTTCMYSDIKKMTIYKHIKEILNSPTQEEAPESTQYLGKLSDDPSISTDGGCNVELFCIDKNYQPGNSNDPVRFASFSMHRHWKRAISPHGISIASYYFFEDDESEEGSNVFEHNYYEWHSDQMEIMKLKSLSPSERTERMTNEEELSSLMRNGGCKRDRSYNSAHPVVGTA